MYTLNLVSILFYDQPLSILKFDDVMPTSIITCVLTMSVHVNHHDRLDISPNRWDPLKATQIISSMVYNINQVRFMI